MRKNISPTLIGVRAHPLVEHAAVNRGVVGSSPTRGVFYSIICFEIRLLGQAVKTSPFHGGNTGSIPVGVIDIVNNMPMWLNWQSS